MRTALSPMRASRYGGHSRPGRSRDHNMDAWSAEPGEAAVIADGMGSTRRGGEAARLVVDVVTAALRGQPAEESTLLAAVAGAQDAVVERFNGAVTSGGRLEGATTLCAVVPSGPDLLVASIGDSRVQLLRGGTLSTLTADHTVAAHLVAVGATEPDSPLARRTANHLRRYLGNPAGAVPDLIRFRPLPGDVWLLSTDGVHSVLDAAELIALLSVDAAPGDIARSLVDAAEAAGGTDDGTAVVLMIDEVTP